jgi:hypothetical protein
MAEEVRPDTPLAPRSGNFGRPPRVRPLLSPPQLPDGFLLARQLAAPLLFWVSWPNTLVAGAS